MRETIGDFNWLRMWVANGNDDGDSDTQLLENPDLMLASGQYDKQVVNVGSLYTVNLGESLSELAGRFQTTVKKLVQINPDVRDNPAPTKSPVPLLTLSQILAADITMMLIICKRQMPDADLQT